MSLFKNIRWVAFSQASKIISQVLMLLSLAWLLPPAEYGVVAMTAVVANFALIFKDAGISAAIIQEDELTDDLKNVFFGFAVLLGTAIAVFIILLAPLMARFFDAPKLTLILVSMAFVFPIAGLSSVQQALMERESSFNIVAKTEAFSISLGFLSGVSSAAIGAGAFSVVIQMLVNAIVCSTLIWKMSKWRPSFKLPRGVSNLKKMIKFSSNLLGFNLVNYFSRNVDSLIVGHFYSSATLGSYSLAYRLMLFPVQSLTFVSSRALYPIFSRSQNNIEYIKKQYLRVNFILASLVAPVMFGLVFVRNEFVEIFLGEKWRIVGELLLWLAPIGFLQALLSTSGVVFMALGRTKTLFKLGIIGAILQVGAFLIGAPFSINLMVKLYLFANILNFFPVIYCCMKILEGKLSDFFVSILIPVFSAVSMMLFLYVLEEAHIFSNSGIFLSFFLTVILGAVFYLLFFLLLRKFIAKCVASDLKG